jgi:hypothetical protein
MASAQHGISRAFGFHPIWHGDYLNWLKLTPWTSRKPLPLGPVELIWPDGLSIGGLILLSSILPQPRAMQLLNVFLLSHLAVVTVTLWLTKTWAIGYTSAFGLGLAVWLWHSPLFYLIAATLVYLLAYEGLRRGFQQFPWEPRKLPNLNTDLSKLSSQSEPCGWPYDRMLREIGSERRIPRLDAVLCCMLGSWWLVVLTSLIADPKARLAALAITFSFVTFVGAGARLGIYMQGYQSPLTLWGRIAKFRLIIPGYDQIFVAPICMLLIAPIALAVLESRGLQMEICCSIAIGMTMFCALLTPPRLRRLTGRHRIVHAVQPSNTKFVKVG